jgi:metallophosphoesterase (TIGR00282 family)
VKREHGVDFCVVNGENAATVGILPRQADAILEAGADVITLGNHSYNRKEIAGYLDESRWILRPANDSPLFPGRGVGSFDTKIGPITVMNLIGRCNMGFGPDNPFLLVDRLLKEYPARVTLLDFHAEASSEKLAMGWYLDGKVSALWGTHTHVPTADTQIFPGGTAFQCDAGMVGSRNSVLGRDIAPVLTRFTTGMPARFTVNETAITLHGILVTIDPANGHATAIERISRDFS